MRLKLFLTKRNQSTGCPKNRWLSDRDGELFEGVAQDGPSLRRDVSDVFDGCAAHGYRGAMITSGVSGGKVEMGDGMSTGQ
jgi:hypothetical protein